MKALLQDHEKIYTVLRNGDNLDRRDRSMKEKIVNKMIDFYRGNRSDVRHFLKVYAYAQTIGRLEGLDEKTQNTLEIAAIVHDIACPLCREK